MEVDGEAAASSTPAPARRVLLIFCTTLEEVAGEAEGEEDGCALALLAVEEADPFFTGE